MDVRQLTLNEADQFINNIVNTQSPYKVRPFDSELRIQKQKNSNDIKIAINTFIATTFFGGLFYLFFHALATMVHSKTDFQALLALLPIMLIVPTFLIFTAVSGYADELPNAEKAGFIPINEAKNIVYREMLKIGVNNINRNHFEKLVKRLAFLVMCGEDPFDVFKKDDSLNTVNQQIETLQKFDQNNIALGVLVAKRDRLLKKDLQRLNYLVCYNAREEIHKIYQQEDPQAIELIPASFRHNLAENLYEYYAEGIK